jgi:putative redox protein
MASLTTEEPRRPQAVVAGDLTDSDRLNGRAGASDFAVGGPDGRGGTAPGANPYDLLSASLAACTAMTIRLQARRRKVPLTHVEVAVSYSHGVEGARDAFDRTIVLQGALSDDQRSQLMQAANICPVGKTLGLSADINTRSQDALPELSGRALADYDRDLDELPIPNIDPD